MKNSKALWESCQNYFKQNVSKDEYEKWLSGLTFNVFSVATQTLLLWVPSQYVLDYLEQHHMNLIRSTVFNTFGNVGLRFHVIVAKNNKPQTDAKHAGRQTLGYGPAVDASENGGQLMAGPVVGRVQREPNADAENVLPDIKTQLDQSLNFHSFVQGDSNKLCYSVGISIAEHRAGTQFNPFFVYGPSGSGKTHLVNAVGLRRKELYPDARVLYISARLFMMQYSQAAKENNVNDFIAFYQTIDMLIVDDIQEWDSPTISSTHNTFFHIFNDLFRKNKQIILVSDRRPVELKNLNERLITRFSCGLVAEMEKPNVQLCIDILHRRINRDGLVVPEDVVRYIAENANGSIRDLTGIVNSLMAFSIVYNCSLNMSLAERVVQRAVDLNDKPITIDIIVQAVCLHYDVTELSLKGKSRRKEFVIPRQLVMFLAEKHLHMPSSRIGRYMGGRDHSTVLHAILQVQERLKVSKEYRNEVAEIENALSLKS